MAFKYNFAIADNGCLMTSDNENFNHIFSNACSITYGFGKVKIHESGVGVKEIPAESFGTIDGVVTDVEDSLTTIAERLKAVLPDNLGKSWGYAADFTIGDGEPGTPAAAATSYANPALSGATSGTCKVQQDGQYLVYGTHFNFSVEGGGIALLNSYTFETAQRYIVWLKS